MVTGKRLHKATIDAAGGHIGSVHDLYFDDTNWTVRYLVVDTGKWLPGRKVLLVPDVIVPPWHVEKAIPVKLTRDEVRSSPEVDVTQPVSRNSEQLLHSHYGWIPYWELPGIPLVPPTPPESGVEDTLPPPELEGDPHLRSARGMEGYHVRASDGEAGHLDDLLLDDDLRRILFVVVDLGEWISGKKVLIPPRLILEIDWIHSQINVDISSRAIKNSQAFEPAA